MLSRGAFSCGLLRIYKRLAGIAGAVGIVIQVSIESLLTSALFWWAILDWDQCKKGWCDSVATFLTLRYSFQVWSKRYCTFVFQRGPRCYDAQWFLYILETALRWSKQHRHQIRGWQNRCFLFLFCFLISVLRQQNTWRMMACPWATFAFRSGYLKKLPLFVWLQL